MVRAEPWRARGCWPSPIIDDGIGLDAADLPHVFDRFYRTDQARRHGVGGTGLGLAIAKAIVETHRGTIAVSSDGPGKGVTVNIRLPWSSEGHLR